MPRTPDVYVYPYFAHPTFYINQLSTLARWLATRPRPRPIRLFFSGTVEKELYNGVAQLFGILPRSPIIEHVLDELEHPKNRNLKPKTKIIITDDITDDLTKHQLSPKEFLGSLALSDFCLCPPGIVIPHCHNMVEAMSVGSIPITNYHNYMRPPLAHGINCLAFNSLEELSAIIESLCTIQDSDIERMRSSVSSYYLNFLDPKSAGENFLSKIGKISTLVINDEYPFRYWHELSDGLLPSGAICQPGSSESYRRILVTGGSGGSGLSLRSDDLDSVVELYTADDLRQLVVAAQTMPTLLRGLRELEDHSECGLVREATP